MKLSKFFFILNEIQIQFIIKIKILPNLNSISLTGAGVVIVV